MNIILALIVLFFLVIAVQWLRVAIERRNELNYHSQIPSEIILKSNDFEQNGIIPIEFTGYGQNISPSLYWYNLPETTKSLVIIVTDYDAPTPFLRLYNATHWVVFNIDPQTKGLHSDEISYRNKVSFGKNVFNELKYTGPKPPMGTHCYYFRIYALNVSELSLVNPSKDLVMDNIKKHIIAYGELKGFFNKSIQM